MDSQLEHSKAALRHAMRDLLSRIGTAQRQEASAAACARVERDALWMQAKSVLFYAPMPGELDIWPLARVAVEAGKILGLPRFDRERVRYAVCRVGDLAGDICIGQYGIREPANHCPELGLEAVELAFVPALAFDTAGRRLGRGLGFYDRLLARFKGSSCGVGFDEQVVSELPVAAHDVPVEWLLTPTRLVRASGNP